MTSHRIDLRDKFPYVAIWSVREFVARHQAQACLRRLVLGFTVNLLTLLPTSNAAVTISSTAIVTPGLPGYRTWTLTATSDGAPIQGFDFVGDPTAPLDYRTSRGIFGSLNQVSLPAGLSTVWTDIDALIPILAPGANAQQDSNFLFISTSLLIISGSARESKTSLQAAFSTSSDFGQSVPVAELVLPNSGGIGTFYRGVVGTKDGREFGVSGSTGFILPEIDVRGNNMPIVNGDKSPSLVDNTNFGIVQRGNVNERTFTVHNLDTPLLTLQSPTLTGPFSIVGDFPTSVPFNQSASFTVAVNSTALGSATGSISFATNAPYENPFNFSLAATVVPEPATLLFWVAASIYLSSARRRKRSSHRDSPIDCDG
jgi:hypothetical protein